MPARSAATFSVCHALCRDSRPPRTFRNTAGLPRPPAARPGRARTRYASSASSAGRPIGTSRCLPPLPSSSTVRSVRVDVVEVEADRLGDAGAGRVQDLQQRAVPQRAGRAGVSSSRSTSSTGSAFGSRRGAAGGLTSRAGSSSTSPSRTANLCSPRTATSARAADDAASGGWSSDPSRSTARNADTCASLDRRQRRHAERGQVLLVAAQVAGVPVERVARRCRARPRGGRGTR